MASLGQSAIVSSCSDQGVNVTLAGTIDEQSHRVSVSLSNHHDRVVWVPQEETPAYQHDEEQQLVILSYGYHDDVYGEYQGRYMVPGMQQLAVGETLTWDITDPDLQTLLLSSQITAMSRVRVALKEIPQSDVRGEQRLDEYIESSCVVESAPFDRISK